MKSLNQLLLDFNYEQNFKDEDFYVGKSNFYAFELINKWPKWEKNFLNICGEKFSGKTHLSNIFLKKFHGIKIESTLLNDENLKRVSCLCIVQHHDSVKERISEIYKQGIIPLIYDCQHKISKESNSKSILEFLGE